MYLCTLPAGAEDGGDALMRAAVTALNSVAPPAGPPPLTAAQQLAQAAAVRDDALYARAKSNVEVCNQILRNEGASAECKAKAQAFLDRFIDDMVGRCTL